jgi:hypothetical protein
MTHPVGVTLRRKLGSRKQALKIVQLVRHLLGKIACLRPIGIGAVEHPHVIRECRHLSGHHPRNDVLGDRSQAVVIDDHCEAVMHQRIADLTQAVLPPVTAPRTRLLDTASGFGKAYLSLLVDKIRLDGNELHVRGNYRALTRAVSLSKEGKLDDDQRHSPRPEKCFGLVERSLGPSMTPQTSANRS